MKRSTAVEQVLDNYFTWRVTKDPRQQELEELVTLLPKYEGDIIRLRYLTCSSKKDYQVYSFELDPPVCKQTYTKYRERALARLVEAFKLKGWL